MLGAIGSLLGSLAALFFYFEWRDALRDLHDIREVRDGYSDVIKRLREQAATLQGEAETWRTLAIERGTPADTRADLTGLLQHPGSTGVHLAEGSEGTAGKP